MSAPLPQIPTFLDDIVKSMSGNFLKYVDKQPVSLILNDDTTK